MQPCGWILVTNLWTSGISDSQYQEDSRIFNEQDKFCEKDLVNGEKVPCSNVMDKGYRCGLKAHRTGKQKIHQPTFKRSGKLFSANDTIESAHTATNRSGNKSAIYNEKDSGYIQQVLTKTSSVSIINDVWMAWGFQDNFMYQPIL